MITSRPAISRPSVQAALSGKRILLTGTTGFLAKVVLEKIIRSVPDVGRLILLIRPGRHGETARQRFEREIAASSIFDRLRVEQPRYLADFFADRIECLSGEAAEPGFGMPAHKFIELAGRVDLIINGAASVNFREPLDQALAINTQSLHCLTALARTANAPLVHISTCYVNGYQRGDMREEIVVPAGAAIPRHRDGYYDVEALIGLMQRKIEALKARVPAGAERERQLTELGIRLANRYGWNDTYTFTKWLGEQIAMRGMHGRSMTIVRPSIIESTLQEPVPGWIEGVKVADAVILAYARGKTSFFPARPDGIIDVIPADLVANSIVLAAAETVVEEARHRIYQCCSGSANPLRLGDMIDRLQSESKRNWRHYDRLFHAEPVHNFRVVNHSIFRVVLGAAQLGSTVWSSLRRTLGAGASRSLEKLRTTQVLAVTFSFYTQPRYRFFNTKLQGLARRFDGREAAVFPVDAQLIDWENYLCRIHMAGLNRYALKRKDAVPEVAPVETALPVVEATADGALAG